MLKEDRLDKKSILIKIKKDFIKNKVLYYMIVPVIAYYVIFHYWPMYGIQIAFKDYSPGLGFTNSPWIGIKHFINFFDSYNFTRICRNTFLLNFYGLIFGFPAPIILALLLNEIKNNLFKRTIQTISYMPYFISMVVVCGMIVNFCYVDGFFNDIIVLLGGERTSLLQYPSNFRTIYIASGIWQGVGWSSIIYFAALTSIDPELYQASIIDGAGRFKQIIYITIPCLMPTIVILLILNIGRMMSVGFEKIILLYSPAIYETADVISTYNYRKGLVEMQFSFSTAVGLFNSVINFVLLITANYISRKVNETSLW